MAFQSLHNRRNFFSDYYLGTVYGRGSGRGRRKQLASKETRQAFERLRKIYDGAEGRCADTAYFRERFARPLLRDVFSFHTGAGEERIYQLFQSAEDEEAGDAPLLLAYIGEWAGDGDGTRRRSPAVLLERALSERGSPYGFLVSGEAISLIRKPGDGPRHACLEFDIPACLESEDEESFAAAYLIFSSNKFLPDEQGVTSIEAVEKESREHAEKVSEDLKAAVFRSAEELARGLITDWAERASEGEQRDPVALGEDELLRFRDASLTCMYRLLFILYAEALDERLEEHELYRKSYSLAGLVEDLMLLRPEEVPSNRYGYWVRLLALYEIYDKGLPAIAPYEHIPPRGGDFFSGDTPVGRMINKTRLDNRTLAELLLDLTTTIPRAGVGRERVSFRELDIEQLGSVYEGLLEFEPRIARNTTIETRVQGQLYALVPDELVRLCTEKNLQVKGQLSIVEGTSAESLHPDAADEDELEAEEEEELEPADAEEEKGGVKKGAKALLLRRFESGDFHFVPGSARKGSGSFYTPLALVNDLVKHALGPLVKNKKAEEIESLRVLDPATGSAHFLVGACRYLGNKLFEAYSRENSGGPPPTFTGSKEDWSREGEAWCKRRVTERCLFGVDLNPTAVNLARVSLWIESLAGDRPLTYFEHHVRCGNSVLGTWLDDFHRPPVPKMGSNQNESLWSSHVTDLIRAAAERRDLIEAQPGGDIKPESLEEMRYKEDRRREAEELLASARLLFDMRMASAFGLEAIWGDFTQLQGHADSYADLVAYARSRPWWEDFVRVRDRERFFHWELEFPERFLSESPGFDAVLGNPPWDKVKPNKNEFYGRVDILIRAYTGGDMDRRVKELQAQHPGLAADYKEYESNKKTTAVVLKKSGAFRFHDWEIEGKTTSGDVDIFKSFVEQAWRLVRDGGRVGFVVPSAIYNNEGCTGLRHLLLDDVQVDRFYGFENRRKLFPIDSRYKFVSLVFRKGEPERDRFDAAFMRNDVSELEDASPKPWMVPVVRSEVEKMSPGTLAFLEYRSPRDREIVLKMYQGKPLLVDQGEGSWKASLYGGLHMTNDKDLWTDPKTSKLFSIKQILGREPVNFEETRALMAEKGFWPLYEGKHIEQFLVDIKPIERWVNLEAAEKKYGRFPDEKPKTVFRDIARNTDERTCIATVLPEKSCCGNTLPVIQSDILSPDLIATVLNSFSMDFSIRLRIAATHLNFTYMERVSVPSIEDVLGLVSPVPTISDATHHKKHIASYEEVWQKIWLANRSVASAYGIDSDDLMHILKSFPVFARKRPDFCAYIASRIEGWEESP
jgi:hypothetical protein